VRSWRHGRLRRGRGTVPGAGHLAVCAGPPFRRVGSLGALAVTVLALGLTACSSHPAKSAAAAITTTTVPPSTTVERTTTTQPKPVVCPLTDEPAPGGQVPQRPALAVKVDNLPGPARPQYGISEADVVYEEPVEGGITRFIVIYQCHDESRIEPVRSGRLIDPEIIEQFGAHPLMGYAGAIQPAVDAIDASPLIDVSIYRGPTTDYWRDPDR
jgi:hypothetical protein